MGGVNRPGVDVFVVATVKGELGSKVVAGSKGSAGAGSGVGILGGGE